MDKELRKEMEKISEETFRRLGTRYGFSEVPRHVHNGSDSPALPFSSISPFIERISFTLFGATPATAANYGVFWVAPKTCTIIGVNEVHQTKGSDAGAVTLQIEKLADGDAPGAGINILTTALSLKTANDTIQSGTLVNTSTNGRPDASLQQYERLCLVDSGTLTALANVTVQILVNYQ